MKLNLNKRELILVSLFALFLVSYIYFNFIVKPLNSKIAELTSHRQERQLEYSNIQRLLASESEYDSSLNQLTSDMNMLSQYFFSVLTQEEIIVLLNDFMEQNGVIADNISFTEAKKMNLIDNCEAEMMSANIKYHSSYSQLNQFIKRIQNFEKKISIKALDMKYTTANDNLAGNMLLEFYSIPLNFEHLKENSLFISQDTQIKENPFFPYEGYGASLKDQNTPPASENPKINKKVIYDFVHKDLFFVGQPQEVYGNLTVSDNTIYGTSSVVMNYDFIRSREKNVANLVFEKNIFIEKQPLSLGLWVYAFEKSKHNINIVLIDTTGKDYHVQLTDAVQWTEWNYIEATLPEDITYPARIERLYVEALGYHQKSKGQLLFNQLETIY